MTVTAVAPEVDVERGVITDADVLHRAAYLLEEFGWCQHKQAVDKHGSFVWPDNSSAVSFCVFGAVKRALFDLDGAGPDDATRRAHELLGGDGWEWAEWNNSHDRVVEDVTRRLRERADV